MSRIGLCLVRARMLGGSIGCSEGVSCAVFVSSQRRAGGVVFQRWRSGIRGVRYPPFCYMLACAWITFCIYVLAPLICDRLASKRALDGDASEQLVRILLECKLLRI